MKRQFTFLLCVTILTISCNRYQYVTIESQHAKSNAGQELVMENDSFNITYNFYGRNIPIEMKILNKLNKPVYVDWKRSSLIVDGKAVSYMPENLNIAGSSTGSSVAWTKDMASHTASFAASAALPVDWQLIPPQSHIIRMPLGVTSGLRVPDSQFVRAKVALNDGFKKSVKKAEFTFDNTPLRFKSFLTFQVGDGVAQQMVFYEHEFYVSRVVSSNVYPGHFILGREKQGNQSYLQYSTGAGVGILTGVLVVGVVAAVVGSENTDKEK